MKLKFWTEINEINGDKILTLFCSNDKNEDYNTSLRLPNICSRQKFIEIMQLSLKVICYKILPESSQQEILECEIEELNSKLETKKKILSELNDEN